MSEGTDPNLLQDFLTEAGELIEQLDSDLVRLEDEPTSQPLLDQIFRALHTIKGAASFLNMEPVTRFAHAAEDALNRLRKGEVRVDQSVMDVMLRSVDVLRVQMDALGGGTEPPMGPDELIRQLHQIADSIPGAAKARAEMSGSKGAESAAQPAPVAALPATAAGLLSVASVNQLNLPPEKADVLAFMVSDLLESAKQIGGAVDQLRNASTRSAGATKLCELAESMQPTADYYGFTHLNRLIGILAAGGAALGQCPDSLISDAAVRLTAAQLLIEAYGESLSQSREPVWNLDQFESRFGDLCCGQSLPADIAGKHNGDAWAVLTLDEVLPVGAVVPSEQTPPGPDTETTLEPERTTCEPADKAPATDDPAAKDPDAKTGTGPGAAGEQTVRVEVARLETLLNLVGEMVLTKNQILGQTRVLRDHGLPHEVMETFSSTVSDLDRLTAELQVGVMRTRMQPLGKLFGRYPRIIRDLARKTGKNVHLEITGGDTEVDKSVLELLGDPLVHMLRNSVDHGLESPEARAANGKPVQGIIHLSAAHQGGHVRVEIRDDGRGIDRDKVAAKAIEKGLASAEAVAQMSDGDVFKFIFAAGLSTADKVSDLSGRGVGMDVVQTNIVKLGGTINVSATKGKGTTIEVLIPLTVAIMRAMIVGVGPREYAVPVMTIHEIVKPEPANLHSIAGRPVMRLRENVLPLVDLRDTLGEPRSDTSSGFAVVIGVGAEKAGLMVDRLVGQQEVVIKPLDDGYTQGGPFSGATIREDGNVSLILDVVKLVRTAQAAGHQAA